MYKEKAPEPCAPPSQKQKNLKKKLTETQKEFNIIEKEYKTINEQFCNKHTPIDKVKTIKRLCKYCDILDNCKYTCYDCKKIQNKKEWSIVRYLRKNIHTKFIYNSNSMLQNCSKKRPDIYFELDKHCLIVEIDEKQHKTYDDKCECARINEIVNGIGGKPVIIIRYNPDTIKNKGKVINFKQEDKIKTLIDTIKKELVKTYDTFQVKIIQIYYNDDYKIYEPIKEEDITDKVAI